MGNRTWLVSDDCDFVEHVTEDAVALRFARQEAGRLRYCHAARAWFVWDGRAWRRDGRGLVLHRIREAARQVAKDPFDNLRALPGSLRFVGAVEKLARTDPTFAVEAEDWRDDPLTLGTPDGTYHLISGILTAADPADDIRRLTAAAPAATADCPAWWRGIDGLTGGDAALAGLLQKCFGRALGGPSALLVLDERSGAAAALVACVAGIFGDYAGYATGPPATAGPAAGARLLVAGPDAPIRQLPPGATLVATGPPPDLRRLDAAARARVTIVPLATPPAESWTDADLDAERPAILRWMLDGHAAWRADGLDPPPGVVAATARALAEPSADVFAAFLAEACDATPGAAEPTVAAGDLYAAWARYAEEAGVRPGSPRTLAEAMQARGFARDRRACGRLFRGLALREEHDSMSA